MTTVGYGDISGTNTTERIINMIIEIFGVMFFATASGMLTTLIANLEEENEKTRDQMKILNMLYKNYAMPQELYTQVLSSIQFGSTNEKEEINQFVQTISPKLRTKVILLTYRETYKKIQFLQHKPPNFVTWICPLLRA